MISSPSSQNFPPHGRAAGNQPHVQPPDFARTSAPAKCSVTDERERLLDEELDETFPASDPPSWTMGGSHVSTLRH